MERSGSHTIERRAIDNLLKGVSRTNEIQKKLIEIGQEIFACRAGALPRKVANILLSVQDDIEILVNEKILNSPLTSGSK